MAPERPEKSKKEKKEKKEKRSEEAGVSKSKKDKKESKEKREKLAAALDDAHKEAPAQPVAAAAEQEKEKEKEILQRQLVSFAVPLADEKGQKKICKTVRKAAKNGTLKRGVKEVVKTLRKSPPAGAGNAGFPGIVIIAGDISPADVISHLPVLCEDHGAAFIFVSSRAELGAAAKTKRPTSVVMIMEKADGKKKKKKEAEKDKEDEEDDGEADGEAYASLLKYVEKEYAKQSFWIKGGTLA